jgi:hypothetical protein
VFLITAVCVLTAVPLFSQQFTKLPDGDYILNLSLTNSTPSPFFSGPMADLVSTVTTATNLGFATFGIYMPSTSSHKAAAGFGVLGMFNFNNYIGAGIGLDMLDNQVTMPNCQVQLQAPLVIGGVGGVTVTPLVFTGAATPVGGMGQQNGSAVGLFGGGLDVKVWGGFGAFIAAEQRTEQPAVWVIGGVRWSKAIGNP